MAALAIAPTSEVDEVIVTSGPNPTGSNPRLITKLTRETPLLGPIQGPITLAPRNSAASVQTNAEFTDAYDSVLFGAGALFGTAMNALQWPSGLPRLEVLVYTRSPLVLPPTIARYQRRIVFVSTGAPEVLAQVFPVMGYRNLRVYVRPEAAGAITTRVMGIMNMALTAPFSGPTVTNKIRDRQLAPTAGVITLDSAASEERTFEITNPGCAWIGVTVGRAAGVEAGN